MVSLNEVALQTVEIYHWFQQWSCYDLFKWRQLVDYNGETLVHAVTQELFCEKKPFEECSGEYYGLQW